MLRTSTQTHFLRELETSTSIEEQEPSTRVSRYQSGLQLKNKLDGILTLTQERPGIRHSEI